jgi:hypothetical protein
MRVWRILISHHEKFWKKLSSIAAYAQNWDVRFTLAHFHCWRSKRRAALWSSHPCQEQEIIGSNPSQGVTIFDGPCDAVNLNWPKKSENQARQSGPKNNLENNHLQSFSVHIQTSSRFRCYIRWNADCQIADHQNADRTNCQHQNVNSMYVVMYPNHIGTTCQSPHGCGGHLTLPGGCLCGV